ncbi:MAG TPA: hypothetical protein VF519_14555 [Mycobacteriales bacterium]|jgi:uncharacterized membrane-anchored protein
MAGNDFHLRLKKGFGRLGGGFALLLVGLGLLSILFAWNGAAGEPLVAAQMPYLVSGGLLGVCLVGLGCTMMIIQAARVDRARMEAKYDELLAALDRGLVGAGGGAPRDLRGLVAAGSASYHRPECRLVDGREDVTYLTPDEARARFLNPCRVCEPEQQSNVTTLG